MLTLKEYMNFRKHKYMRLDGSSKISDRRDMVKDFQTKYVLSTYSAIHERNSKSFCFLFSNVLVADML